MKKNITIIIIISFFFVSCATTRISEEDCLKNSQINICVLPLQNDTWGVTIDVMKMYRENCYKVVDRILLSAILREQELQLSGITENEYIKIGKLVGAQYLVYGNVYSINKPYNAALANIYEGIGGNSVIAAALALKASGIFVYANLYRIDIETGVVVDIKTDVLMKHIN